MRVGSINNFRNQQTLNENTNKQTFGSFAIKWETFELLPEKSKVNAYAKKYGKKFAKMLKRSKSALEKISKGISVTLEFQKWNPTRTDTAYPVLTIQGLKYQPKDPESGRFLFIGKTYLYEFKNTKQLKSELSQDIIEARESYNDEELDDIIKKPILSFAKLKYHLSNLFGKDKNEIPF